MRDGLAWRARWSRPTAEDGTTFTLADGSTIAFKPGQVWVVLLDRKRRADIEPMTEPAPAETAGPTGTPTPAGTPTPSASPRPQ